MTGDDEDRIRLTYTSAEEFERVSRESGLAVNVEDLEVSDKSQMDTIYNRMFGPDFEKPCRDPNVAWCARLRCQEANECQGSDPTGSATPVTERAILDPATIRRDAISEAATAYMEGAGPDTWDFFGKAYDAILAAAEQERDDYKADYLRRHKDAVDRFEELIIANAQLAAAPDLLAILTEFWDSERGCFYGVTFDGAERINDAIRKATGEPDLGVPSLGGENG